MITGANALKYHCLRQWIDKLIADGPEPPIDGSAAMRALAQKMHVERIARCRAQVEAMRDAQ